MCVALGDIVHSGTSINGHFPIAGMSSGMDHRLAGIQFLYLEVPLHVYYKYIKLTLHAWQDTRVVQ